MCHSYTYVDDNMDFEKDLDKNYNKFLKYFSNGIIHNLMLWTISKKSIHGYGLMKSLEEFFNGNCEIKINSSKIYPILKKMEENELIKGEWKVNENNKRVKYYSISPKGELLLSYIQSNMNMMLSNPKWLEFIKDSTGMEIKI